MRVYFKRGFLVFALLINAICFQNCAPGFQPLDVDSVTSSSRGTIGDSSSNEPEVPAPSPDLPDAPTPRPPSPEAPLPDSPAPTPNQPSPDVPPTMSPSPISGYTQARYKELKWGYAQICGLSFKDEIHCWWSAPTEVNQVYTSNFPMRVIPVPGTTIDFASLRAFEIYTCFNVNPTRDVYCFTARDSFVQVNGTTVRTRDVKLTPEHKRLSGVKKWGIGRANLFFLDQEGRLNFINLESRSAPQLALTVTRFKDFVIDPIVWFTGITINNEVQFSFFAYVTEQMTLYPTTITPDQVLRLGNHSVLSDGRIFTTSFIQSVVRSGAEPLVDRVGTKCFVSANKNVHCINLSTEKIEFSFSYASADFKQIVQPDNMCGLKMDGSFYCRNAQGKFLPVYEPIN